MSVFDRLVGRASAGPALTVRRSGRFEAPAGPRAVDAPDATPAAERGDVQHLDPTQDSRSTDTVRHRPAAGTDAPRAAVSQSSGAGAGAGADPAPPAVPGDPGRDEPRPATAPGTSGPTEPRRPALATPPAAHQPPPSRRVPAPRQDAAPSVPVTVPAAAAPSRRPPDGARGPLPDRTDPGRPGPVPAHGTGPTAEPTTRPTTGVGTEPIAEVRTESSAERSTGVRTVSRDELLAHLAPALAADGALSRHEAGRLVAVPSRSTRGDVQRRPGRPTVGLDPVDVPAQGEVHLHIDRVDVHRPDPQPAPAPRSPAPARDDHTAYLARQESRWRR